MSRLSLASSAAGPGAKSSAAAAPQHPQQQQQAVNVSDEVARLKLQISRLEAAALNREVADTDAFELLAKIQANGDVSPLYTCRSLDRKLRLLTCAEQLGSPDTVLSVVLFMQETLAPQVFFQAVKSHDWALQLLLSHLEKEDITNRNLGHLYVALGRMKEAAMLRLRLAYREADPQERLQSLKRCVPFFRQHQNAGLTFELKSLLGHIELLNRQLAIEANDAKLAAERAELIFEQHPRRSIVDVPLARTVGYCLLYHPQAKSPKLSCPTDLKTLFELSEKQWCFEALKARSLVGDWDSVKGLVAKAGLFSAAKSPIGWEPFLATCAKRRAPFAVADFFAALVPDKEERYQLCLRHALFELAIKYAAEMQAYERLLGLADVITQRLGPGSQRTTELLHLLNTRITEPAAQAHLARNAAGAGRGQPPAR